MSKGVYVAVLMLCVGVMAGLLSGCPEAECAGEEVACYHDDADPPSGKCFFRSRYCEGCNTVTQYKGRFKRCVDEDGNSSEDCSPPCYKQQCREYTYAPQNPCGKRTTIEACDKGCGYELQKMALVDSKGCNER